MNRVERKKGKDITVLWELWKFVIEYKLNLFFAIFFLLFTSGITLGLGQGIRFIIDNGFVSSSPAQLKVAIIIFLIVALLLALGTFFRHFFVSWLGERVTTKIRDEVYKHTVYLHPSFFELNSPSEIQSRLTADITLLQTLIGSSLSMALRNIITFIGGSVFLFFTNVKLSLVVLASVPFIIGPILIFARKLRSLASKRQKNLAKLGVMVNESLFNIKTLQAYNHQTIDKKKFSEGSKNYLAISKTHILFRAFFFAIAIFSTLASIATMLYLGGLDVLNGKISAGDLGAFIFYAFIIASSLAAISEVFGDLQLAAGASERLMQLYKTKPHIESPEQPINIKGGIKGNLQLSNLNFSYGIATNEANTILEKKEDKHRVLHNINISLEAGKTYALVGPSGAGKSTLFDLLLRFYDPDTGENEKGSLKLDGYDIRNLNLFEYRDLIATVPQNPIIFSGTVAENIRYSKESASLEEIKKAARLSYAHEFIEKMPNGYDTFLGENGERLSGGQKQRLVIARAFLKNPKILLLDEATNSLDAESEYQVHKALRQLTKNRTTLVIAHSIATVAEAHKIFVIEEGQVIDQGKHSTLYKKSKVYRRFCDLQFKPLNLETK